MHQCSKLLFLCTMISLSSSYLLIAEEDSPAPREIEIHFWLKDAHESILSATFPSSSPLQTVMRFIEQEKHKYVSDFSLAMLSEPDQIRFVVQDSKDVLRPEKRLAALALGCKKLNLYMITEPKKQ